MDLRRLLTGPAAELPRSRKPGQSLSTLLREMYAAFLENLEHLIPDNQATIRTQSNSELIHASGQEIRSALRAYMGGSPHKAYKHLSGVLDWLKDDLIVLSTPRGPKGDLYRLRSIENFSQMERKDIFHPPFDLRHRVTAQRYIISGWPSLYLGGSILVCWEELGRPPFHSLCVASFRAQHDVRILDFGYRPKVAGEIFPLSYSDLGSEEEEPSTAEPSIDEAKMVSYITCWPLLAACSVRALHAGASFIEEYTIPQLLLQWLQNEDTGIDGICYFSTKMPQMAQAPYLATNYVFPVKKQAKMGCCAFLKSKFELTSPVPWVLLDEIDLDTRPPLLREKPCQITPDIKINYGSTVFRRLERKLLTLERRHLT